ncbi:tetratricopeptide repeat protein [Streptomyces sp. NPDC056159]|uniref:tetratricopeptide repeat protein n=1 Tax=Streptomyces sp. NPDC056159 TaxID=3155537 RepID=UPI00341998B9
MTSAMDGRADGSGRVYQSSGDQHIIEHHHHGEAASVAWTGTESVRQPTGGRAPMVLRDRIELMERLREAVAPATSNQVLVLHGMGGCGKTAVARTLFQYATNEGDRVGLWVNATDRITLRSGMLAVAADRGALEAELNAARSGLRASADLVWERLDMSDRPWLLVLDNADEPAILRDGNWLRSSPRGTVLVTTRLAAARWWPHAELHHVGELPRDAAAQVLYDLAPGAGTVEEATKVADRLGRLPLALVLAGGFLSHQVIEPWTMTEYGRHLDGHERVALIDQGVIALPQEDARHLISRTWQLSLDALAAQGLPESTVLLRLLACYGADPLPLTLLKSQQITSLIPVNRAEAALRGLLDQSLTAVVDVGVRCIQTHAVLLASVQASTPHDQVAHLTSTAAQLLDGVVPAIPQRGPQDLRLRLLAPHVRTLLRHAMDMPVVAVMLDVAVRLACALHRTGDYLSAWELASDAAAFAEPILGSDHRLVLSAQSRTARALFRLGKFGESERLHRHVLANRERLFGPDDPDTLESCFAISQALSQLGREAEAIALFKRAADGRRRILGPEHALTLRSRGALLEFLPASDLAAVVDDAEMPLPQECALHLGPDHAVTLGSRLSYGVCLLRLGRIEEAAENARDLVEEYTRRHGPDYALTLAAQSQYAQIQAALGDLDSAIELMVVNVERRTLSLGADHPYTLASREILAGFQAKAADHLD